MPKQINVYQYGQSLVRLFGLKGRFQPVLDEVIVPTIDVGSEPVKRFAMAGAVFAGGALTKSYFQLKNLVHPAGFPNATPVNLVVTYVFFIPGLTTHVRWDCPTVGPTLGTSVLGSKQWRETDRPGSPHGTLTVGEHDGATPAGSFQMKCGTTANLGIDQAQHIVVEPGWTVGWFTTANNTGTNTVGIEWYEQDVTT